MIKFLHEGDKNRTVLGPPWGTLPWCHDFSVQGHNLILTMSSDTNLILQVALPSSSCYVFPKEIPSTM